MFTEIQDKTARKYLYWTWLNLDVTMTLKVLYDKSGKNYYLKFGEIWYFISSQGQGGSHLKWQSYLTNPKTLALQYTSATWNTKLDKTAFAYHRNGLVLCYLHNSVQLNAVMKSALILLIFMQFQLWISTQRLAILVRISVIFFNTSMQILAEYLKIECRCFLLGHHSHCYTNIRRYIPQAVKNLLLQN